MRTSWNLLWGFFLGLPAAFGAQFTVNLDNLALPGQGAYWNGSDESGAFRLQNIAFHNDFYPPWFSWWGIGYSNINDTNTPGWGNQYASFSGTDVSGTGVYAVVYDDPYSPEQDVVELPVEGIFQGFYVNNGTYTALSMRDGDGFAKKFGGASGNDEDWFLLTITGKDSAGSVVGTQRFYLADFRFTNNLNDYIVSDWTFVSLTNLGSQVKSIHFDLTSSDVGDFGMNTPAYFVMDELTASFSYGPGASASNSSAVSMTNTSFLSWATGWTNYQVGAEAWEQWQTPELATGIAVGTAFDIVSLGRGGQITMTFDLPIANGPGPDFAVFENGVTDSFLELAWVEVSSDGSTFFRFPAHSLTEAPVAAYGDIYPTNLYGFAGIFRESYGTPFDLDDLDSPPGLNDMQVRFVRLIDIVGDGSQTDHFGNVIYDPYPTIESAGFDLDAIGSFYTAHEISTASEGPGSVSPGGTSYALHGQDFMISITPDPYHEIEAMDADGVSAVVSPTYTFTNVTGPHSLEAAFIPVLTTNGIPHWWLADSGITNDFDVQSQLDLDGDAYTAEQEFYAGTADNNAEAFFHSAQVIPAMGSNCLEWIIGTNGPDVEFSVEGTPHTLGGEWLELTNGITRSPTGTNRWYHTYGTNDGMWIYRVKLTP